MAQNYTINLGQKINIEDDANATGCIPEKKGLEDPKFYKVNPAQALWGGRDIPDPKSNKNAQPQGHVHGPNCSHGHGAPKEPPGHDHGDHDHDHEGHGHEEETVGFSGKPRAPSRIARIGKWFQERKDRVRVFVLVMPFQATLLTIFWLGKPLEENPFEYWFSILFMSTMMILSAWTYLLASYCNTSMPSKPVAIWAEGYNATACKTCENKWKPERSHHCQICKKCTLRMDHHCPWLVNCVGHRNHKPFLLFCLYMMFGGVYFIYRTIYYWRWASENGTLMEHDLLFLMWWFLVVLVCGAVDIMLTAMAVLHSVMSLNNVTTLETMSGTSLRLPGVPENVYLERKFFWPGAYDVGMFANICNFFDHDALFWWVPQLKDATNDGTNELRVPEITEIMAGLAKQKKSRS